MIKKILKRMVGLRESHSEETPDKVREKINGFQKFAEEKASLIKEEYYLIRKKLENLNETNYRQGLKYLEKGDLRDAILRFRIVVKFWPDNLDAHYQLAYSLVLHNQPLKAKMVLEELLSKHPDCNPKARELLAKVSDEV